MKKYQIFSTLLFLLSFTVGIQAQNASQARKILDRTSAVISKKGGASANFTISGGQMTATSGTIMMKGNKFYAHTPQATVWFNGNIQWTYMKSSNEVNVTKPNEAKQAQMNPYKFINLYRSGYALSSTDLGKHYQVYMKASDSRKKLKELYITIDKKTYTPVQVKMMQGTSWITIQITQFQGKKLVDSVFNFNSKDFPTAEVIDLR